MILAIVLSAEVLAAWLADRRTRETKDEPQRIKGARTTRLRARTCQGHLAKHHPHPNEYTGTVAALQRDLKAAKIYVSDTTVSRGLRRGPIAIGRPNVQNSGRLRTILGRLRRPYVVESGWQWLAADQP